MDEKMNNTKKEIIKTAKRLMCQHGYDKVTINDICRACDISKHTFYYYFESKEAVLQPFYTVQKEIEASALLRMVEEKAYIDQLWVVIDEGLKKAEDAGKEILRQMFLSNMQKSIARFSDHAQNHPYRDVIRMLLLKAKDNHEFNNTNDPETLFKVFLSSLIAIVQIWVIKTEECNLRLMARKSFEVIFDVREDLRK